MAVDRNLQVSRNNFANAFQQRIAPMTGRTYTPAQNYQAPDRSVSNAIIERMTVLDTMRHPKKKASGTAGKKKKKKKEKKETTNILKRLADAPSAKAFKDMSKDEKETYLKSVPPEQASAALESLFEDNGWRGTLNDAVSGGISRGLDLISRPAYAEFAGLTQAMKGVNAGQEPWEVLDDAAKGAWHGAEGKQKAGFGDFVQQVTKPPSETDYSPTMQAISNLPGFRDTVGKIQQSRELEKLSPDDNLTSGLNRAALVGLGASGDVFLDPWNAVRGSAATVSNATGEVVDKAIVKEGVKGVTQNAVKRKLIDAGHNPHKADRIAKATGARVENVVDTIAPQVRGGTHGGTTLFGGKTFAPTVAGHATDEVTRQLLDPFERYFKLFDAGKLNTQAKLDTALKNPMFKRFYDEALDLMSQPNMTWEGAIERAKTIAKGTIDDTINDLNAEVFDNVRGAFYNAPAAKVFNKKIPFKRIGKAYNTRVTNMPWDFVRDLSHAAQNPGRLANLNNAARSLGLRRFSQEAKEITKIARNFSRSEREELSRLLFTNTIPADPKMEDAFKFIKNKYAQVFADEIETGVRSSRAPKADNYQYLWMKGPDDKVAAFKKARKDALKGSAADPTTPNMLTHGLDEAIAAGVKPERDAFKNLQYRMAKSQRDMTRSYFNTALLDDYGFQTKRLTAKQAAERNLVEVKGGFTPGDTTLPLKKSKNAIPSDEAWYLPKEINDVLEKFKKMSTISAASPETKRFLKVYDWFLNKFKYAVTVMYPGFHVRNSIGDIFFGLLDGVGLNDYKTTAQWFADRFPKVMGSNASPKFTKIHLGRGQSMTFDEVWELYQTHAASGGFFHSDLGESVLGGGGNPITKAGSRANQALRKGSEGREDLMRFAHFVKALKTEIGHGASLKEAVESSAWRVNKYHFDYGALTPLEKNGVKRVVPFYTFMRKAIPVLLESMFMNPRWLSVLNRAQEKVHDDEFFSPLRIPDWQLEAGTTNLTPGEQEPWMLDSGLFPTGSLSLLDQTTAQGFMQELAGQTAPIIKAPFEMATGRSTFNAAPALQEGGQVPGTPITTNKTAEYLLNNFIPPARTVKNLVGPGKKDQSTLEFLLGDRMGLGLGIRKLKSDVQNTTLRHNMQKMATNVQNTLNPGLEKLNMKVYFSNRKDGASFRVKDTETNDIVFDGTLEELIPLVEKISKQQ